LAHYTVPLATLQTEEGVGHGPYARLRLSKIRTYRCMDC
jgi:hypothetical protein